VPEAIFAAVLRLAQNAATRIAARVRPSKQPQAPIRAAPRAASAMC
jgi:hypothetical protein